MFFDVYNLCSVVETIVKLSRETVLLEMVQCYLHQVCLLKRNQLQTFQILTIHCFEIQILHNVSIPHTPLFQMKANSVDNTAHNHHDSNPSSFIKSKLQLTTVN